MPHRYRASGEAGMADHSSRPRTSPRRTDHAGHKEQGSMIRRYIIRWSEHAADERLREVVNRAHVA